jgi:hypothetical protein
MKGGSEGGAGVRTVLRATGVLLAVASAPAAAQAPSTPRPIHDSAQRQVEAVVRARLNPCEAARTQGVPCFPVSIEREGPRFSVADAVRSYQPDGRPAPGVPTGPEIQRQMSGAPRSAAGGVSTDPTCAVKSLVRLFKGQPNTFFLYRARDPNGGEEPLLSDHKLDPAASVPTELVGEFKGECEAIAAWRRLLRRSMEQPATGEPPPEAAPP